MQDTAEQIWTELMQGNARFVAGKLRARDVVKERAAIAHSPRPKALVLCCADPRVDPDIIFDTRLGDLFVLRVAGNTADKKNLGSMEFAITDMDVPLAVVLGHMYCGAVKIACSGQKVDSPYLKAVIERLRPAVEKASGAGDERLRFVERENARLVAHEVVAHEAALHERIQSRRLAVIPAYYNVETGVVERL
ncbi:MAG: carbonic anhydrase [Terriglobales bacterium]